MIGFLWNLSKLSKTRSLQFVKISQSVQLWLWSRSIMFRGIVVLCICLSTSPVSRSKISPVVLWFLRIYDTLFFSFLFRLLESIAISFCQLDTNLDIPGRRESELRIASNILACGHVCGIFFFSNDGCGRAQHTL